MNVTRAQVPTIAGDPKMSGRLFHDQERDIWYECVFDQRKQVFTWTILPPGDGSI